jgi:uncharacterized RDD family membrane protein YckC
VEEGQVPRSSGAPPVPAPSSNAGVGTYEGPVPPGGWHQPIPDTPVPGRLAGWWRRGGAAVIDGMVALLPAAMLALGIVALFAESPDGIFGSDTGGLVVGIISVVVSFLSVATMILLTALVYAPLTMRRSGGRNGQTLGKQLLRIRVVRMNGDPQTFASAAVREVVVKLLLFGVVGGTLTLVPTILDVLWPLWDRENRALHDMVVDTRVVRA